MHQLSTRDGGRLPVARRSAAPNRNFGSFSNLATHLHDELTSLSLSDHDVSAGHSGPEPLYKQVARAKARWLRRIMYGSVATSTEKCFAYAVADHLNCVTLDAWPG